jgi:hypothetical protein
VPTELRPDPAGVHGVDEDALARVPARGLARDEEVAELGLRVQAHRARLRARRAGRERGVVDAPDVGAVGRRVHDAGTRGRGRRGGARERGDEQLLEEPVALRARDEVASWRRGWGRTITFVPHWRSYPSAVSWSIGVVITPLHRYRREHLGARTQAQGRVRVCEEHVQLGLQAGHPVSLQTRGLSRTQTYLRNVAAAARTLLRSDRSSSRKIASRPVTALSSSIAACAFARLRAARYTFAFFARSACDARWSG